MNHPTAATEPTPATPGRSIRGGTVLLVIFLAICAGNMASESARFWPVQSWLNVALVITALIASIAAFAPTLAWPNVALAAGLAAASSGMAYAVNSATGFPFGEIQYTPAAGPLLLGLVPWWLPLAWAAIALGARGSARLLLHRTQQHPHHGYRVIAVANGFALLSTLILQAFTIHGAHLWKSAAPESRLLWSGFALHLLIQIALTPLLIDKFPGPRRRNFRPLWVWLGTNLTMLAMLFVK